MFSPILANYYITYRCNAQCRICDIWNSAKYQNIPDAKLDNVKQNLHALKKIGVRFIDFTGGEPLLHHDLSDMLKYARKLRIKTSVTTNCISYPYQAEALKGLVDYLHFSMDSIEEKHHNFFRGTDCFDSVMESLLIADKLGEKPDILFTVTEDNWHETEEMIHFCQERKIVLIINPVFTHVANREVSDKILRYLDHISSRPYVYVNKAFNRLRRNLGNSISSPRCRAVSSTVVISPDNKMLLPCFHHYNLALPVKNLYRLHKKPVTRWYRKMQGRFNFCKGCSINCYFDPSFQYKLDAYFLESIAAKAKYWFDKNLRPKLREEESSAFTYKYLSDISNKKSTIQTINVVDDER